MISYSTLAICCILSFMLGGLIFGIACFYFGYDMGTDNLEDSMRRLNERER